MTPLEVTLEFYINSSHNVKLCIIALKFFYWQNICL